MGNGYLHFLMFFFSCLELCWIVYLKSDHNYIASCTCSSKILPQVLRSLLLSLEGWHLVSVLTGECDGSDIA